MRRMRRWLFAALIATAWHVDPERFKDLVLGPEPKQ